MGFLRQTLWTAATIFMVAGSATMALADSSGDDTSYGQTIYVPAYSHINTHLKVRQPLASTVVIHNVDPEVTITLQSVAYYDQNGVLLKSFLTEPVELGPYVSASYLSELNDSDGGIGANYIVVWDSTEIAQNPVSQAIMIGGTGTHGISFLTDGRVIQSNLSQPE